MCVYLGLFMGPMSKVLNSILSEVSSANSLSDLGVTICLTSLTGWKCEKSEQISVVNTKSKFSNSY